MNIRDEKREMAILSRAGPFQNVFREILKMSRRIQKRRKINLRVGIAGFGKMGRLFARELDSAFTGFYSEYHPSDFSSIQEMYEHSDVIILASKREKIKRYLIEISRIARKSSERKIVFDISTIKSPIVSFYANFPDYLKVASVHPMFGPGIESLENSLFIVTPVEGRIEDAKEISSFIQSLGGRVEVMDVRAHERLIKYAIGLPYAIGVAYLDIMHKRDIHIGGTSYKILSTYGKAILNDSEDFIREILNFSEEAIKEFQNSLDRAKPSAVREFFKKEEIREAYEKFYSFLQS